MNNELDYQQIIDKIIKEFNISNYDGVVSISIKQKVSEIVGKDLGSLQDREIFQKIAILMKKYGYANTDSFEQEYLLILEPWGIAKSMGGHFSYQKYLETENNAERLYKETDRELKWYEKENAKQQFDDYPKVKREKNIATIIAIVAVVISTLELIVIIAMRQ